MSQEYIPVTWVDETDDQVGTVINKARLDQMQTAHHYADGFEEVDVVPTSNPGVNYHKVVFCTADMTFYRWTGSQWVKDILSGKVDKLVTKPTAGTYTKVTINSEGQVTGGANPTTLSGYGITDAVTLGTAQTITAVKTFTANPVIQSSNYPNLILKDTNSYIGDNTIGGLGSVVGKDRDDKRLAECRFIKNYSGGIEWTSVRMIAYDPANLSDSATIELYNKRTEKYATAPYRTYASGNVNDVVTIGSLASNPNVLHSTGNETKTGNLTVNGAFTTNNNLNVKKAQPRTSMADTETNIAAGTITTGDRGFFALYDVNGSLIGDLIISIDATGKASIKGRARNSDGTTRTVTLV